MTDPDRDINKGRPSYIEEGVWSTELIAQWGPLAGRQWSPSSK